MKSPRIAWKTFGGVLAAAAAGALAADLVFSRVSAGWLTRALERELVERARGLAESVAPALEAGQNELVALPQGGRLRYTLIAPGGEVLRDSHADPRLLASEAGRAELAHPGAVLERPGRGLDRAMRVCAEPVRGSDGTLLGYARVAAFTDELEAERAGLLRRFRAALGLGLVVSGLGAVFVARSLSRPIGAMVEALETPSGRSRLPVRRADELGRLARAINRLGDELEARVARLRRDQLEKDAILSGMAEGVVAVDESQVVVLMNATAQEMLGVAAGDPVGRPLWEVTRVPEVVQTVAASIESGRQRQGEARIAGVERQRVFALAAAPLVRAGGRKHGSVLVLHEVTELRRLEAVRRDFVANVSHELKTPLTAMRGYLETVLDDPEMPAATRTDFLQKAERSTARLAAIVSDLLSLARVESETGPDRRPLDLRALVRDCVAGERANAERRLIALDLEAPETEVPVAGDERLLATAVRNLLDNAIKYSSEEDRVRVVVGSEGPEAWVDVIDRGPGIPLADQERVFERFYRVDKDRSRAVGGTGLGLSIVRNVVAAHEGEVELDSRPGRGSRFRIRLPRLGCGPAEA